MKVINNWGQEVIIPTREEWEIMLADGRYNGDQLSEVTIEYAGRDLEDFKNCPEIVLEFTLCHGRESYLRMLKIDNNLHRVHFEDVICEHCGKRTEMSATPDLVGYAGATRAKAAQEAVRALPIKNCKHCHAELSRRNTIWFRNH